MLNYNKNLKQVSQKLRGSMTDAELLLWSKLKGKQLKGLQFYRQKIIGKFIVDFYCAKAGLVIEVDGGQHYTEAGLTADADRDRQLQSCGLRVLRYSDNDVLTNIAGVMESIYACVEIPPTPLSQRGRVNSPFAKGESKQPFPKGGE